MVTRRRARLADQWGVRLTSSLAAIVVCVPAITFGSVAYWDALTTTDVVQAVNPTCTPDTYGIVENGVRYVVEEFTSVGTCDWAVPTGVTEVDYLVVGGGGGGGGGNSGFGNAGGGGGGGEAVESTTQDLSSPLTITVGSGGSGGSGGGDTGASPGTAGGTSSIVNSASTELATAVGGGGGSRGQYRTGGTGGAGGWSSSRTGGAGPYRHGGGGAGASATGNPGATNGATPQKGGDGGAGLSSSISGVARAYGGGGGGGSPAGAAGLGGSGGGGNGASDTNTTDTDAVAGADGFGGGGGGGDDANYRAGKGGGSGIVILRYEVPGSSQDRAFAFDTTMSNTSTSEYYEATGNVSDLDADGTIEAWVYFDPDEDAQYAVWGVTRYLYLSTWAQDRTVNGTVLDYPIRVGDGWTTEVEMPQRQWSHIAVTWNGTDASLYINGTIAEQTASFTAPSVDATGTSPFRVGAIYDDPSTPGDPWSVFWDGNIDEVRVWDDVRTQPEIADGMHTTVSSTDANLAAYWDFNQTATNSVSAIGSVGAGATLTKIGAGDVVSTEFATADTASRSGWTIHKFERSYITTAGGWTVPDAVTAAEVLVVGGGGGGGAWVGAGGGGGGVLEDVTSLTPGSTEAVTVGQGGLGSRMRAIDSVAANDFIEGSDGGSTSFAASSVLGGGLGATWDQVASSFATAKATGGGGSITTGNGSAGTGSFSNGGAPQNNFQPHLTGGGGGAGGNGVNGGSIANTAGAGGPGLPSTISGSTFRYGGGGGGGAHGTYSSPPTCDDCATVYSGSGTDGGGDGAAPITGSQGRVGNNGTPNRGGGGGGASNFWGPPNSVRSTGGLGGSGVVIVAYPMCTVSAVQSVTIGGIEYRYQEFTTPDTDSNDGSHNGDLSCSDSWTVPSGVESVDVLVVAGGGGGGANGADLITGGGGGAGGLILDTVSTTPGDTISVSVGSGGDGAVWGTDNAGQVGANTIFGALVARGGGGGGSLNQSGTTGGSGGGNGYPSSQATAAGAGTAGQGSSGVYFAAGNTGGSGGGASGSGQAGITSSMMGTATVFATGGGPAVNHGTLTVALEPGSGNGGNAGYDYAEGIDHGQAGSSGTVIVRWAVDPADALPVIDLYARYRAGDYDAATKIWTDSSGNGRHTVASAVNGTPATATAPAANGSDTTFPIVSGGTNDSLAFPAGVLPGTYTLFHLARYGGAAQQQIITATNTNWLSGFWIGKSGIAYQAQDASSCSAACWITQNTTSEHGSNWVASTDQPGLYRSQGVDRTTCSGCSAVNTASLSINRPNSLYSDQVSDWQVADLLVFDRQLSTNELRGVEAHLGRAFGVEMPGLQATGVTGARVAGSGTTATVTWTDPSDVTATGYTVEQSDDAGSTWTTASLSGSADPSGTTVTGLTAGTSYQFRVLAAVNEISNELVSSASAAVTTAATSSTALTWSPSSPTSDDAITITATVTSGGSPVAGATVAFTADATTITGCNAVTTDSDGEATCSWGVQSVGTVTVAATATGDAIITSNDSQSVAIASGTPGQPTALSATANGTGQIDLAWTSPASGATPTDYAIEYRRTGSNSWFEWNPSTSTSTSDSVTGLGSNSEYEFRVIALANGSEGTPSVAATATTTAVQTTRTFSSSTTWIVPDGVSQVDVLVVGGGGGGGGTGARGGFSGGGGAGGSVTEQFNYSVTPTDSVSVAVGAGGSGGSNTSNTDRPSEGGSSSFDGTITAAGGGRGGHAIASSYTDASSPSGGARNGGGGGAQAGSQSGASGTSDYFNGGSGYGSSTVEEQAAGGGAGAGANGAAGTAGSAGNGGNGVTSTITGLVYGGGGGGGVRDNSASAGAGGTGGGGAGGRQAAGSNGTTGRGGGGGGGGGGTSTTAARGGNGGNGAVVVRHSPAPTSTPDLVVGSDTGASSSDDVTGDATPTFTGTAQYNATVQLFVDDGTGATASGATCSVNASTYTWTCTTGTLSDDDYEITAVATFSDVDGTTINQPSGSLSVTIDTSLTIDATTLSEATVGTAYTTTLTASGGIAPVSWTVSSGALPTGVTLSSAGVISGTPTVAGDFTFTATVTDSNSTPVSDSLTLTLTVSTIAQTLAFTSSDTATWGDTITVTATRGTSGQPIVFATTGGTATGCSITSVSDTSATLTSTSAGTCTITANQAGNATHAAAPEITQTFTIARASQTITFTDPADITWSTTPVAINPTSDSGLAVSVTSSTTDVCTVSAGSPGVDINLLTAGACTLTASQTGNTNYLAATDVERTFTIAKASEAITFTLPSSTSNVTYGDNAFGIAGSIPSGRLLSYVSSTPAVCTVTSDETVSNGTATNATVSVIGAGTCTITASRSEDNRYEAATDVARSFTVAKAAQSMLSITSGSDLVWGDSLTVAVAGGSGAGAVTFGASAGTAGCTINTTTGALTFTSAGTCDVTADKASDTNYLAASQATQTITIAKASQTVSFTSTVPANPQPGGTYSPTATASSGLTPALTITAGQPSVCTLSSGEITFLTTGTCTVSAAQSGDSRFSAATTQSQTISVGALNQTITIESIDDIDFGAPAFTLDAEATSGLVIAATSTNTDVCTVTGLVVTPLDIGTCDITLTQTGDSRYAAASPVSTSFRIQAALPTAPSIVSVSGGNGDITVGFSAPGFTGGIPVTAYEITASPTSGDAIIDRSCDESPCTLSGLINGTDYTLTVAAINTAGTGPASELSPSVTPATRATAVRQLNATPGNGTMRVAWTAPTDLGGGTFTRYELRIAPDGDTMPNEVTATVTSSASESYTFTGLDNGVAYNVEIVTITTANQQALTGNTATLSSVPVTTPSAPTELTINSINPRQITIAWSEPLRDGGATVTGYTATVTDGDSNTINCGSIDIDATTRSATCTSEQLELSTTYSITVGAVNRIGTGPVATATHTTPTFTAPTAPPVTTDGDIDPEITCPCILDADGNPTPVDTSTTPVGNIPGETSIAAGTSTITLGGGTTTGSATTWVDANGNLVAQTPGTIPLTGSGALPGTTVTIFLSGTLIGTAIVAADGTWSLNVALPDGTIGSINLNLVWIDDNGTQNTLLVPIIVNATGDAATAPRTPAGGAQLAPDPDSAVALGPNGELIDSIRTNDSDANTITVTVNDTTVTVSPAENGEVATNGRLTLTHPARVRVTGQGMLPGATATVWIKSDPQRLGTVTITADGLLDATFPVPTSIDPGNHTIQIDTTDPDGEALTLALGLTITSGVLPTTGTNTNLDWIVLFIALGCLSALVGGRRRRELH